MEDQTWIARNKDGKLRLFTLSKPWMVDSIWIDAQWVNQGTYSIGQEVSDPKLLNDFQYLNWGDEPVKININEYTL